MNSFREPGVVGSQFGPTLGAADVELEFAVVADAELMAEHVGLRCVTEGLVQHTRAGYAAGPAP